MTESSITALTVNVLKNVDVKPAQIVWEQFTRGKEEENA